MVFQATSSSSEIATWIIAISFLISTIISILMLFGYAQQLQMRVWKRNIESKLSVLESYARRSRERTAKYLRDIGVENPEELISIASEYFTISPVSIEPIDIIRRLERILRTGEERIEELVERKAKKASSAEKKIAVTLLSIMNVLNMIYKYVRHILLWGLKTENPLLLGQLMFQLPLILRIARSYYEASKGIADGRPIGDAAGPLFAYYLMNKLPRIEGPIEIAKDTIYSVHELEGRKVVIVKAKGPGSTVGRPGEAVEKLAEKYGRDIAAIITVDAALKFEGEETGAIAEGAGVAMGDPGPEKIRIERVAARLKIPVYAFAIKLSLEEAINTIPKEVVEAIDKVIERVEKLIRETVEPGKTVIVVGVGNTLGVAQ
ncbi:MAG TPA: DUF1512 domain-containing protein [Pyrodictium sp.]|nr:DUF1512 domain-containing protein [Pyrodictium sp.]HIQ56107.1 DUF1512 domain-containing protein [Pyrodictium sp.]